MPTLRLIAALCLLSLAAGTGCREWFDREPDSPHTRVLVFNRTGQRFDLAGEAVEPGFSGEVFLLHAAVERRILTRSGQTIGVLALTSLVPANEQQDYDAAVTVHEPLPAEFTLLEFSPWFDVVLENGG